MVCDVAPENCARENRAPENLALENLAPENREAPSKRLGGDIRQEACCLV